MSTLIDRYVWATVRTLPQSQRADVERELRASIADAVESQIEAGARPFDAEQAALTALGDPALLAADYADRPLYLIGPGVFLDYQRSLTLLVSIVTPIAVGGVLLGGLLRGGSLPGLIADAASAGLSTAIQLAFWTTLLFAVLERSSKRERRATTWKPADLPNLPIGGREDIWSTAFSVAAMTAVITALYWQHVASPFRDSGGVPIPILDPVLWTFWLPFFMVMLVAEAVFAIVLYRRGGWTQRFALVNVALNVLATAPAIMLLRAGRLFNPAFVAEVPAVQHATVMGGLMTVFTVVLVGIALIDIVVGFVKARRASNIDPPTPLA